MQERRDLIEDQDKALENERKRTKSNTANAGGKYEKGGDDTNELERSGDGSSGRKHNEIESGTKSGGEDENVGDDESDKDESDDDQDVSIELCDQRNRCVVLNPIFLLRLF